MDNHAYDIIVGKNFLFDNMRAILEEKIKNKNIFVVFDAVFSNKVYDRLINPLSESGYRIYAYPMVSGKQNKTISEAIKIYELLELNELSRDSTLIALGGGVVGDLAGFVASTYLRGINLIHIPTTLTAMIDSSIGGKVAINFRKTINAIGNYYHPVMNVIDLEFTESLPQRDFKAGLSEIIKCAVISDRELFEYLAANSTKILARDEEALLRIMIRAMEIKLDHVRGDVRESGKRLKLNLGHTIGHAIEVSTDVLEELYRHGEGVALGMIGAAFLANEYFRKNGEVLKLHEDILSRYGLPLRVEAAKAGFNRKNLIEECMANIYRDKKKANGELRFIFPREIGHCEICHGIEDDLIKQAFNYLIQE